MDVYDQALHRLGRLTKSYEVISCNIAFHGTADMGATANALSPGDTWNFVGTYDVAGMVEMNEGGMANGQGTASMFMDGVAAESQVGCEFTSPIQGNTTLEVKADPEAWANGSLKLQIHLESMPVSFGGIGCTSFGGKWNTGGAAVTTASFDLDPVLLPGNGGATSLEFQLPDQPGTFKMDLIAVIEEARIMKIKLFLYLALILVLLGCSFFSNPTPAPSTTQPADQNPSQTVSTEGWLLPDPTVGLASLTSYQQELTISFQGKKDGGDYEWVNSYRRDVWAEQSADFLVMTTSETGQEPGEMLRGKVGQAGYSRIGAEHPVGSVGVR